MTKQTILYEKNDIVYNDNPFHPKFLKNNPFNFMTLVLNTVRDEFVHAHYVPKKQSQFIDFEKDKVSFSSYLKLILTESLKM